MFFEKTIIAFDKNKNIPKDKCEIKDKIFNCYDFWTTDWQFKVKKKQRW